MFIHSKDLLRLPVETKSGDFVGKVSGFDMDIETHFVRSYYVRAITPVNLLHGSLYGELVINSNLVISITKEKMIVEDGAVLKDADEHKKENIQSHAMAAGAFCQTVSRVQHSKIIETVEN
jgi:sporulation protein YlmC with PRC-barrel domain